MHAGPSGTSHGVVIKEKPSTRRFLPALPFEGFDPLAIRSGHQQDKDAPKPFTIWTAPQKDKVPWDPQHFTIWSSSPKERGCAQPFTIWRLFPSRRLTADFLLPHSACTMCHLHCAVGRSPSVDSSGTGVAPPNPSRFGALPKRTRTGLPQPSTISPEGQGFIWPPPTLFDLEWPPKRTRIVTIWNGSPKRQRWDAPTLHDWVAAPFQEAGS